MPTPQPIDIKICGLSNAPSIDAAIRGGANHLGFIFFEQSPRNITPQLAGELGRTVPADVTRVAVSVDVDDNFLEDIITTVKPDMLQFHGSETPERLRQIKARYGLPVMKAFAIRQASDFDKVEPYLNVADRLLFDAKPPPGSQLPGGNGVSFDWGLFANWQREHDNVLDRASSPMLSGGLDLENIEAALASSNAGAIDVSSGVEKAPGVKDAGLIEAFLVRVNELANIKEIG